LLHWIEVVCLEQSGLGYCCGFWCMFPSDCLFAVVSFVVFVWCCCVLFVQSCVGGCRLGLGLKLVRVVWLSTIWTRVWGSNEFSRNWLCWCSLLDSLIFSGLLRAASLDASGSSSFRYRPLVRCNPCDCFRSVARKSFIPAALLRGLVDRGSCYCVGGRFIHQS